METFLDFAKDLKKTGLLDMCVCLFSTLGFLLSIDWEGLLRAIGPQSPSAIKILREPRRGYIRKKLSQNRFDDYDYTRPRVSVY